MAKVHYAEIIASIASRSAGPGTRANIDEFTETTSFAIETVGNARRGKAIIVLNPAEPPLIMRDTVYVVSDICESSAVDRSVREFVEAVRQYVPGYRIKQALQFEEVDWTIGQMQRRALKTSVFLEVQGAADYLPAYAGNLDIMTSAALRTGEQMVEWMLGLCPAERRTLD